MLCSCYEVLSHFESSIDNSIKILRLIIEAKAFNKIDVRKWFEVVPDKLEPKIPTDWRGALVIDRYVEYVSLLKSGIDINGMFKVEEFVPTPLDLLTLVRINLIRWKCDVVEIINWVIKYLDEFVLLSNNLTEAYDKLRKSTEYRELLSKRGVIEVSIS